MARHLRVWMGPFYSAVCLSCKFVYMVFSTCVYVPVQLMSKSSEKPRLHQIPSEDMDSEDGGGTSPTEPTYQSRVRAEALREAEPTASKNHEEQLNLQHALILNQVGKHTFTLAIHTERKQVLRAVGGGLTLVCWDSFRCTVLRFDK